jgi:Ca-activated chloride channel family protein
MYARALLLLFSLLPLAANAAPRAMLVFDASGSMWGQIGGKSKLEIARQAAKSYVASLPAGSQLGLLAYGHRQKDSCTDIETLVPPGPVDAKSYGQRLDGIKALGKTPLARAITQAAEALDYKKEPATVIVVTDGIETCHADPCAVAQELASGAKQLTIHVIGFDIKAGERQYLQCYAQRTGGRFVLAGNAADLNLAFADLGAKPADAQALVMLAATPQAPKAGSKLTASWSGYDTRAGDFLTLTLPETPAGGGAGTQLAAGAAKAVLTAPEEPGDYELRYIQRGTNSVAGRLAVTVAPSEASVRAPAMVGGNQPFAVQWTGPKNPGDTVALFDPQSPQNAPRAYADTNQGSPAKLLAPAQSGEYEVRYTAPGGKVLASQRVTVTMEAISLSAPASVKRGQPFTVTVNGTPGPADFVNLAPAGSHRDTHLAYKYPKDGRTMRFTAPAAPGEYELRYFAGAGNFGMLTSATVSVK